MNIQSVEMAWIAAVLAPWTVSPHPNFSGGSVTATQALALVTERRNAHVERGQLDGSDSWPEWSRALVEAAQSSLLDATQSEATASLWALTRQTDIPVGARVAAAAYAALGSLELDEASYAVDMLASLTNELSGDTAPDVREPSYRLAVAVLHQQRVARAYDSFRFEDASTSITEVNRWLPLSSATGFEDFPVSKGISWGSATVQRDISTATRQNALAAKATLERFGGRGWVRVVRARSGWIDLRQHLLERSRGAAVIRDEFEAKFESTSGKQVFGRESATDVAYNALLIAELSGDVGVARANRTEMAKVHLLARGEVEFRVREALRLLRQSNETATLKTALGWIRAQGPLEVLRADALRILSRAERDRYASESDLLILESAADMLDQSELARSILVARVHLETLERTNRYSWTHLDNVWKAITRFLPGSEQDDDVAKSAGELLQQPKVLARPLSNTLARLVAVIDWTLVSDQQRETWLRWVKRQSPTDIEIDDLVLQVRDALDLPDLELELASGIQSAAILADDGLPPDAPASRIVEAQHTIISALKSEADAAATGTFAFGGIAPANVAVAFALRFKNQAVWDAVVEHLIDSRILYDFKESALDRLASNASHVPLDVRDALSSNWHVIADSRRDSWFGGEDLPLAPAALRMAAAFGALDPTEGVEAVLKLNASSDLGRMEAAQSIPLIADREDATWAHVLLLQLANDANPNVRAEAGFAMIRLLSSDSFVSAMVAQQATALLQSDGIRCSLRILHGLQSLVHSEPDTVAPWLALALELAESDPRRIIREAARELLKMADR